MNSIDLEGVSFHSNLPALNPRVQTQLEELLNRLLGVHALLICNGEGTPLINITSNKVESLLSCSSIEDTLAKKIVSTFETASTISKEFGPLKTCTTFYKKALLVHSSIGDNDLVVTFVCERSSNAGMILNTIPSIQSALLPLSLDIKKTGEEY